MALNSRNFFISTILVFITFSFLIDKFQDTTNNRFLFETSSQSQDAIELFEKYFKQEQEQPSMELVSAHVYTSAILPEVFYEIFSDEFVDQYWENIATASHEPAPVIF